jgi:hypothetical protein
MHWTQKPENRTKVLRMLKRSATTRKRATARKRRAGGQPHAATRAKVAKMRAAVDVLAARTGIPTRPHVPAPAPASTVQLHLNGHAITPPLPLGLKLAQDTVLRMAANGARQRLAELAQERETLLILIQAAERAARP